MRAAHKETPPQPSLEARLASSQKRRDTFLVIVGQARQRELVDVHVAGEVVERMRQAIDGQLGHGDRERRLGCDFGGEGHRGAAGIIGRCSQRPISATRHHRSEPLPDYRRGVRHHGGNDFLDAE
jgi:hypothetical protein